jgi:hypothetical protein
LKKNLLPNCAVSVLFAVVAACTATPPVTPQGPSQTASLPASGTSSPSTGAVAVFGEVSPSLAYVETGIATGSAFVVDARHVATCAHVVRPYAKAQVRFPPAAPREAAVVAWDLIGDLAVLEVNVDAAFRPIRPGRSEGLAPGSRVYLAGFPLADRRTPEPTIAEGVLGRSVMEWGDTGLTYLQSDAVMENGQSGGLLVAPDGSALGVTCASRGRFAMAMAIEDAALRIGKLQAGEDVDGLTDRLVPAAPFGAPREGSARIAHRADVHTWVIAAEQNDRSRSFSMNSTVPAVLVATAGGGGLVHTSGRTPTKNGTVEVDFSPPGPYLLTVEPSGGPGVVQITGTVPIALLIDPDDGRQVAVGDVVTGAADYGGDIDWLTIKLHAFQLIVVRATSVSMDPFLFLDRTDNDGPPLAKGPDLGGPVGWDDEFRFTAPVAGTYLLIVSDARRMGSGAYRLSVTS